MAVYLMYVALCILIAFIGSNRKFGFWGYFFCSLFLTPAIGALVLVASDPRPKKLEKCPKCAYPLSESATDRQ